MSSQFHKEDDGGFHHPQYGYVSPQDLGGFYHPEYGYVSPRDLYGTKNRTHKNSYQKFFRVLGSWLPPTIALLFVVSFELGRRKRLNDERERQNSILKVERDDKINGVLSTADKLDGEQQTFEQSNRQEVISVSEDVLGYGGHGTVVYKGILEGRSVAVKRMLKAYHASADREISLLIESDGDPNVVRYFLKEVRGDFVYLALELCDLSLHELIAILRVNQQQTKSVFMYAIIRILLQIASGVKHLHSLRIVHRDMKPANILLAISKRGKKKRKDEDSIFVNFANNYYDAKISDMGLGKQLMGQSSIGASLVDESTDSVSNATDSKEHQPADLQPSARTSRSVDIFSLGCIFYSVLIPGCHPFGEWFEREANIMHNRPKLDPLKTISTEAFYLVRSMLDRNPRLRPTAKEVCQHPFFWDSQKKLAFLCDFSDRLETDFLTQTQNSSNTINSLAIERSALDVIGTSWEAKLDSALIDNVQKFRTYDYSCIRDLLRLIRNKHHHFDELPEEFRLTTAPNQNALCEYFGIKFPALVMHCYTFCGRNLPDDDPL
ncbi:kinase-like protein, partial [Fragilariopsis cylindrus CCMP1102]